MRSVEFLVSHGSYAKGEIAGFEDKIAARLVARRVARFHVRSVTVKDDQPIPVVPEITIRRRNRKQLSADVGTEYITK